MRLLACSPLLLPLLLLLLLLLLNLAAGAARKRRSLTFPKGSAFVLTVTMLKAIQVREPSNWNLDLEFDVVWPIPNDERVDSLRAPLTRPILGLPHRRHRRQLYANFELALDSQGLPGKQCVLRAICEARFILNPAGVSLVEDLLRVIFTYPGYALSKSANDVYDSASMTRTDCDIAYPCPFSLLDMLLNYQNDVSI